MITNENKKRILEAIATNRTNYPSDAKHAASLGISTSVYSAIKNGQTDKALSEANWITIARRLGVKLLHPYSREQKLAQINSLRQNNRIKK